jgi:hypothetical protein
MLLFLLMLVDGVVVVVVCYYHWNTFIRSTKKKRVRDKWHWLYRCEKSMWWWLEWKWTSHVTSLHLNAKEKRVKFDTHTHTHMYIHTTTTKMTMTTINSLVNARVVGLYSNPLCVCVHVIIRQTRKESVRLIRHSSNSTTSRLTPDKQEEKKKKKKSKERIKTRWILFL